MNAQNALDFIPASRRPEDEKPISTPQTDPTNPERQEAVGIWTQAELGPERQEGVQSPPVSPDE
jgi:hypothetical protein